MRRYGIATVLGWALLTVPVLTALLGPLLAGATHSEFAPLLPPSSEHPFGTDVLGRDVLALEIGRAHV